MFIGFTLGSSAVVGRTEQARPCRPVALRRRLATPWPFYKPLKYAAKSGLTQDGTSHISNGKPTLLGDLLTGSRLAELVSRARDVESLHKQIKDLLPRDIAAHITGASRSEETVVVFVDSAAWATRVRFEAPELLKWLSPRFDGAVDRVQVRVRPAETGPD
jgi:hypothetical protein